ncbi:MFS transporter [Nonomuraea sp. NPDC005650]|uniref:MFS transporter n=1 Tax=Nonomuraea sp. NPDC005650 TaxID=3157045 RepID=UPI0033BAF649
MAFTPADRQSTAPAPEKPEVGASYIGLLVFAVFGVYMAFVTPIAISLAIRISQLAPGNEEYLGYVTGAGSIASVLTAPLVGMLSDRTRSRFGRRRPFFVGLTAVGVVALLIMAQASSVLVLGLGWILAQMSWNTILALLIASQADRLPESQRGKVSGLGGMVSQLAPVAGTLLAGGLAGNTLLLFMVPGAAGVVAMALFVCFVREPDSRQQAAVPPVTASALARTYVFDPRRNPDFAWNWLGKFLFMSGLTFSSTFTAFFLASRLGVSVEEVAGTVAVLGGGGIVAAMLGAIGGGFLSDRLRRRRVFVLVGSGIFATGAVVMALSPSVPVIMAGAILGNLGIGVFSAVDQALALDVLPERETEAGRYTGIYNFSTTLAQGIAPLLAPLFLAIGASGGQKNYTLLYAIAAALTVAGGLVVLLRIKTVR